MAPLSSRSIIGAKTYNNTGDIPLSFYGFCVLGICFHELVKRLVLWLPMKSFIAEASVVHFAGLGWIRFAGKRRHFTTTVHGRFETRFTYLLTRLWLSITNQKHLATTNLWTGFQGRQASSCRVIIMQQIDKSIGVPLNGLISAKVKTVCPSLQKIQACQTHRTASGICHKLFGNDKLLGPGCQVCNRCTFCHCTRFSSVAILNRRGIQGEKQKFSCNGQKKENALPDVRQQNFSPPSVQTASAFNTTLCTCTYMAPELVKQKTPDSGPRHRLSTASLTVPG